MPGQSVAGRVLYQSGPRKPVAPIEALEVEEECGGDEGVEFVQLMVEECCHKGTKKQEFVAKGAPKLST